MDKIKVYYDRTGNTLTVWFQNPEREHVCEEVADDIVLMKDKAGKVIGFEKLNYQSKKKNTARNSLPVEVQVL